MRSYYHPELDVLRFVAFLMVFSYHTADYTHFDVVRAPWIHVVTTIGAFGVPVFFLLSAFLITELLLRELEAFGRISAKFFYTRRVLRIWPLYIGSFVGLSILGHFLPDVGAKTVGTWIAFLLFFGNWYITFCGWIAGPIDPLWSISVEEQFYILIPLVAKIGRTRGLMIASIASIIGSYGTILYYALHPTSGDNGQWTNSFLQFQFFGVGVLLACLLHRKIFAMPLGLRIVTCISAALCWRLALHLGVQSWNPHSTVVGSIFGWLAILAGTMLLFLTFYGANSSSRLLANLGRISFGLYVYHSLVLHLLFINGESALAKLRSSLQMPAQLAELVGLALAMIITITIAQLSYSYFETPFINLKKKYALIPSR